MSEATQGASDAAGRMVNHYRAAARRFLQTAIVVDDLAFLGGVTTIVPYTVAVPTGSVLNVAMSGHPASMMIENVPPTAGLDAKMLSDAFLEEDMICGLYKPTPGEEMVKRSIGAAIKADIVIVDWNLEQGSSKAAKDIIKGLLEADLAEKGRLRLIAVYTSQPGLADSAAELLKDLEAADGLKGTLEMEGVTLVGRSTRVVFLNKRGTPPSDGMDAVTEEGLPCRLIEEFSKLGEGLLASFALSSVAAVRRGAHHVLALYGSDLDGAFVAHRCGIPHPDDAQSFATDMIATELRNLIEIDEVAERSLGADVLETWVQARIDAGHVFKSDEVEIPAAEVKKFVRSGAVAVEESASAHHAPGKPAQPVSAKRALTSGRLPRTFYSDAVEAIAGTGRLSRLSTFQREAGRSHYPQSWLPVLSLGSVLQGPAESGGAGPILICVQPRCDSVRLTGNSPFPFQTAFAGGNNFNLVLRDAGEATLAIWVNLKPKDGRMISFVADPQRRVVLAAQVSSGTYVFTDTDGDAYVWLGDLKEMKAQRWAGELGSRVTAVGIEELEWLRLAGERKFGRQWT